MAPKGMKSFESDGKIVAKWQEDSKTEFFLKICIEEIEAGNRPTTHFTKEGWKNITDKFLKNSGFAYDRNQLKNRWDTLKREFASFAKLVEKHTGLGWDNDKQTIMAPDEWWAEKGKEDLEILKWKNGGPKFIGLLEKCFTGSVATGFALYEDKPPCEVLETPFEVSRETRENNTITKDGAEEDSLEVWNEVQPNPTSSSSKKRKYSEKGEKMGTTEKLQRSLDRLINGLDPSQQGLLEDNISYDTCLNMLDKIPSLTKGSHLHFKAVRMLGNKEHRTTFAHFMNTTTAEMALDWLDTLHEKGYSRDFD